VIPAAALVLLPLASEGHQRSASGIDSGPAGMTALLPALDAVHVVAGALWIGAVLLLLLAVTRRAERSATDTSAEAAGLASRVGRTALVALGVVTVAGAGQAVLLIDTPSSLVDTAYGTTLIAKVALVAAAVTAAWLARRRAGRVGGWQGARRLLRVELALLGSAVLVTGVLVTLPPPVEAEAALFTSSAPLGDGLLLDVGVDGSRPGRTELHVYVIEDGALTSRGLDVRATMTSVPDGIGPFRVAPLLVEPGHWFAALEPLPAGEWSLEVTVGLDRFTERTTTFTVPLD
jgi:copper transport protein